MEVLPFAKMCVQYQVGVPLPNSITVVDLDPVTGCKTNVEVKVSYLNKPLVCSNCKSLGHNVSACPTANRVWIRKSPPVAPGDNKADMANEPVPPGDSCDETEKTRVDNEHGVEDVSTSENLAIPEGEQLTSKEDNSGWTEVKSKRKPSASPCASAGSPSPQAFHSGTDGLKPHGRKQNKRTSKRAKKVLGSPPPRS